MKSTAKSPSKPPRPVDRELRMWRRALPAKVPDARESAVGWKTSSSPITWAYIVDTWIIANRFGIDLYANSLQWCAVFKTCTLREYHGFLPNSNVGLVVGSDSAFSSTYHACYGLSQNVHENLLRACSRSPAFHAQAVGACHTC